MKTQQPVEAIWNKPVRIEALASASCDQEIRDLPAFLEKAGKRRAKLSELAPQFYCSVIGTCLSMGELRRLMSRWKGEDLRGVPDLTVHEEAVTLAARQDSSAKFLQKALDKRHASTIARFELVDDAGELRALWEEAKKNGDLAGAYWAVLTHRSVTAGLRQLVFADIHMLSHLVGATNRADLQRLAALEDENAELKSQLEELKTALFRANSHRDRVSSENDQLREQLTTQTKELAEHKDLHRKDDELSESRTLTDDLRRRLTFEIGRRERAEERLETTQLSVAETRKFFEEVRAREQQLTAELEALESEFFAPQTSPSVDLGKLLRGSTLLYVGGHPGRAFRLRAFTEGLGAALLYHDGGLEERTGLLPGLVNRADAVFFPVDCVSHEAAGVLKRLCRQTTKAYCPLRTASLASFVAGLHALTNQDASDIAHVAPSLDIARHDQPRHPVTR